MTTADLGTMKRLRILSALPISLLLLYFVSNSIIALALLLPLWCFLFRPWDKADVITFAIASFVFLGQDYAVLCKGGFYFTHHDFLLMPCYEPFLWGFYFLHMKRVIGGQPLKVVSGKAILGLLVTVIAFSVFAENSRQLLVASLVSTSILLILFHESSDVHFGLYGLLLGIIVELFGVSTNIWYYPYPDILGIPYWFSTMWISVGILGRRFLFPLSEILANRLNKQLTSHT